jgi:hypothetical protein
LLTLNRSEIAKQALDWIRQLYEIEREVKHLDNPQRLVIRLVRSKLLLDELKRWLLGQRVKLLAADVTSRAIDYTLKPWGRCSCMSMMRACRWTSTL